LQLARYWNGFEYLPEANVKNLVKLAFLVVLLIGSVQTGFSRGDKVIPQVVDGPGWSTKFDLTNISSAQRITKMRLAFYTSTGTPWTLPTNRGNGSELTLTLEPRQTIRVETLGGGSTVNAGYAIIYDEETLNSDYSEDFVLGISVFYQVSIGSGVADTVTVSVPQPTAAANAPMQMDDANGIYSGLAIVNLSGTANEITVNLYPAAGGNPPQYTNASNPLRLPAGKQWAGYLDHPDLFPALKQYKGTAQITSLGPIALLGLLQTRAANGGPQYSTLVPVDREALRRNTHMVMLQASTDDHPYMPIDFDIFAVDYFRQTGDTGDTESYSWDLEYRYDSANQTSRWLEAWNGAAISSLGVKDGAAFDQISVTDLKDLAYSTSATIDLSDRSSSLVTGFTFAVHTDVGNYAKVRIVRIIETVDGTHANNRDLVFEVCIYK